MAKLRKTIHREVQDILDSSVFTSDDFQVIFGESDENEHLIHIELKYGDELYFSVSDMPHSDSYSCTIKPGSLYERDVVTVHNVHQALMRIPQWALEARNELKAESPLFRDVEELKRTIEEHFSSNADEEEFSVEEINSLKGKFDDLLRRVEELEKESQITQKQFEEFKSGIEQVSDDLEYYPKATWVKTASNKIYKTIQSIGKSKEGRAIIADGAKKLLGLE